MTNYNLEEFKNWLEAEESRYNLNSLTKSLWTSNLQNIQADNCFNYLIELKDFNSRHQFASNEGWKPYQKTVLEWIQERKRERAERNPTNMVNAQTWLEEKFPTPESKQQVRELNVGNNGAIKLEGELDFSGFSSLKTLIVRGQPWIIQIKGLENLSQLEILDLANNQRLKVPSCLAPWKQEVERLKEQLAEYEAQETSSSLNEPLNTKLQRKKAELQTALTSGRRSTAPLRKEVELLERILSLEGQINALPAREAQYQQEVQVKEQTIQRLETRIRELSEQSVDERVTNLQAEKRALEGQVNDLQGKAESRKQEVNQKQTELNQKQTQVTQLNNKVNDLQTQLNSKSNESSQRQGQINTLQQQMASLEAEKKAWEERILKERQEALNTFKEEKVGLEKELTKLKEAKDTFRGSADYLRETLKGTEKTLDEIKQELAQAQEDKKSIIEEKERLLGEKSEELRQRNEGFKVVSERNAELQSKLSQASGEIDQLSLWIGKLESASGEGDAFSNLKKDLENARGKIESLEELLSTKKGKSYWWVYVLVALVGIYLVVK